MPHLPTIEKSMPLPTHYGEPGFSMRSGASLSNVRIDFLLANASATPPASSASVAAATAPPPAALPPPVSCGVAAHCPRIISPSPDPQATQAAAAPCQQATSELFLSDVIGHIMPFFSHTGAATAGKYGPEEADFQGAAAGADGVQRGLQTFMCTVWFLGVEGSATGHVWTSVARGGMPLLCMLWGWHCMRPAHAGMQYITVPTAVVSVVLCWWMALGSTGGNHHDVALAVVSVYIAAHTVRRLDIHDTARPVAAACTLLLQLVLCLMAGMMRDRKAVVAAWGLVTLASVCWVEMVGDQATNSVRKLASIFGGTSGC